ncbi:MAG: PHP domain-containing protein [Brooklawnia sp.]|nr:PHP domain-containing protein [Brooklawnia sp.]
MRIDLHTHSNLSDGTDTPTRLVLNARNAGLEAVALTDHDTLDGVLEARAAGRRVGVHVVPGVELSTEVDGREVHLLGYGPRLDHDDLNAELARIRLGRRNRLPAMLDRLARLGVVVTMAEVQAQAGAPGTALGRPHVADALIAKGEVVNRQQAFDRFLDRNGPAFVPRPAAGLTAGIDLLHAAGAAVVLAHPGIRGMDEVLTGDLIEMLAREHGLDGIEVDYPLHDTATRDLYHRLGARLGLVRTGSSDYHGTGKAGHDLGSVTTRPPAFHELLRRIAERGGVAH